MHQALFSAPWFRRSILGSLGALIFLLPMLGVSKVVTGPAPVFALPAHGGGEDGVVQRRNQVILINFWASWCEPCRTEFPALEALYQKYKGRGFVVLAINIEPDAAGMQSFLTKTPVSFPVLLDPRNTVVERYGVDAMPSTILVDKAGNQRFLHRGYTPGDESTYERHIMTLLAE